jgi:EAL domain-containing protein (putative c-di-GMP-specific phosphodiesterase class I)
MSTSALEELRERLVDDPVVRSRLLSAGDRQAFIADVIAVAHQCGIDVSAEEIEAGLAAARQQRLARWV